MFNEEEKRLIFFALSDYGDKYQNAIRHINKAIIRAKANDDDMELALNEKLLVNYTKLLNDIDDLREKLNVKIIKG